MRSIQGKLLTLTVLAIMLCAAVVGGLGMWSTAHVQETSTNEVLALTCHNEARKFDQQLMGIQSAVSGCAEIVADNLPNTAKLGDEKWRALYLSQCERLVGSIARHVPGICTYYLRFEPSLSDPFAGFFYTRKGRSLELTKEDPITDILAYDPSDTEHVGWYYQPRDAGSPIWLAPYYNQNIGVNMVSYVVPMYVDDTFIGVVGMDVDFTQVINITRSIKTYQTGHAFLTSNFGEIYYHPELRKGSLLSEEIPELYELVVDLPNLEHGNNSDIMKYSYKGTARELTACKLNNGMYLMISVDSAEIDEPVNQLFTTVILVGLLILAVVVLAVILVSRRITGPLVQLAGVANQISEGNLDVEIPKAGNDEVGALAQSLDITLSSLRSYIDNVSAKAYSDALTKVKNKASYELAQERLQERMEQGSCEFALVMLDVNDLKAMNDLYGHHSGDEYLRACCHVICKVFAHSPVYRIGGDEFVVLLEDEDYRQRDELIVKLDEEVALSSGQPDPWMRVSLSKGVAVYGEGDTSVDEVFDRADKAMYEDKRRSKRGRT